MPTYGYECLDCARSFETIQRITEDALTRCDECGGILKKKVFPVGVVFKGSGFYVNDYAKKGSSGEPKTDTTSDVKQETPATSAAPATDASPSPSTTESKPEPTPTAAPAAPSTPPAK
jgi:putative FmdB family regulatory protein